MAKQWQLRRGTTAQNDSFTGAVGEVTVDTTTNELRIHDGSTVGGHVVGNITHVTVDSSDLFDFKYTDHLLNNASWARADLFDWISKTNYPEAYNALLTEYNSVSEWSTDSSSGLGYKQIANGHKITNDANDNETVLQNMYNTTGSAWFYIIDTTNERFKLPRAKPLTDAVVGNGKTLGLTNGTTTYAINSGITYARLTIGENAGQAVSASGGYDTGIAGSYKLGMATDATKSGVIVKRDVSDQYKYLYFYLKPTSTQIDCHRVIQAQLPTAENNYTWYRLYSDGWVEQGGGNVAASATSVTFPITMADTYYTLVGGELSDATDATWHAHASVGYNRTTTGFTTRSVNIKCWTVYGMAA